MSDEDYIKKLEERVEYLKSDVNNKGVYLPTMKLKVYHKHGLVLLFILSVLLYIRPSLLYSKYFDKERYSYVRYFSWSKLFVFTLVIYIILGVGYYYYQNRVYM